MKTKYVVGFRFCGEQVLLLRKQRPAWQNGKLNGVGGKIERGETPMLAMACEWIEEVCLSETTAWEHRIILW